MTTQVLPNSDLGAMLDELAGLGMRVARVVAALTEIEQAGCEAAARWLPETANAASLAEAIADGQGMDAVEAVLATAGPRVEGLARAFDRVARSVRRCVALRRRLDAGWPRAGSPDDRQAMVRRQVARGVAEAIRREADGEAAERLFDELAERMEEPGIAEDIGVLPVEEMVRRVSRDLGLATETVRGLGGVVPPRPDAGRGVDTG